MKLIEARWCDVPHYWPFIEDWVREALAHGDMAFWPEDIRAACMQKQMALWIAETEKGEVRACAVTAPQVYPRLRSLAVLIIGGVGMKDWLHLTEEVEGKARDRGFEAVEGPGREGWERVMAPKGYRPVFTVYRKML